MPADVVLGDGLHVRGPPVLGGGDRQVACGQHSDRPAVQLLVPIIADDPPVFVTCGGNDAAPDAASDDEEDPFADSGDEEDPFN